jgi:hypothetical protein
MSRAWLPAPLRCRSRFLRLKCVKNVARATAASMLSDLTPQVKKRPLTCTTVQGNFTSGRTLRSR